MRPPAARGLLDTSVFIALETDRAIEIGRLPDESVVCPVTIAGDLGTRARRLATLESIADVEVLVIDTAVAAEWARLRVHLAENGLRVSVNDLWVAATAAAHGLPVVTQGDDFDQLDGVGGLSVIRV